jgi:hypothetical protein
MNWMADWVCNKWRRKETKSAILPGKQARKYYSLTATILRRYGIKPKLSLGYPNKNQHLIFSAKNLQMNTDAQFNNPRP